MMSRSHTNSSAREVPCFAPARVPRFLPFVALFPLLLGGIPGAQGQTPSSAVNCDYADQPLVVCTESGPVRGVVQSQTLAFKGIPYAQPPVGPLRWRPPEERVEWEDILDASEFGDMCPQLSGDGMLGSEDCLTLNIWSPRDHTGSPLPVMVFLTGGGNHGSSGQLYDGQLLVKRGEVVFVSYNLRVGVFGFLAHPALDAERAERISGNYGSLDQVAMLRWLQRNIAAFGGDPSRVFLFGTSAGGGNICALMTSPLTGGLFAGASMQSSVPTGCNIHTLEDAQEGNGRPVVEAVGCASASDIAACLRGKGTEEMVRALPGTFGVLPRLYGPVVDGHIFPDQPIDVIAAGRHHKVPVIIGTTSEETIGWVDSAGPVEDEATYMAAVERVLGPASVDAALGRYPPSASPSLRLAFAALTTDALFTCRAMRVASVLARSQSEPVYRYLFTHPPHDNPDGAGHSVEQRFLFPWREDVQPTQADQEVRNQMVRYWTRMARTGDPNGSGDPQWLPHTSEDEVYLEIALNSATRAGPSHSNCEFWDAVSLPWPHL